MALTEFLIGLTQLLKLRPNTPASVIPLPEILLGAGLRPGISVSRSLANVLADKKRAGLPTGNYADGTPNYDDQLVALILKEVYRALLEDLRVSVAIPSGIAVQANGASAAGPVSVAGETILPSSAFGIIQ
jgi:hypothetical protein